MKKLSSFHETPIFQVDFLEEEGGVPTGVPSKGDGYKGAVVWGNRYVFLSFKSCCCMSQAHPPTLVSVIWGVNGGREVMRGWGGSHFSICSPLLSFLSSVVPKRAVHW